MSVLCPQVPSDEAVWKMSWSAHSPSAGSMVLANHLVAVKLVEVGAACGADPSADAEASEPGASSEASLRHLSLIHI